MVRCCDSLEKSSDAFFQNYDFIFDSRSAGFLIEQLQRFFDGFVREAEGSVVHRNHPAGLKIQKGFGGIRGIGVNVAKLRRVVGTDWQQSEFGRKATTDLAESGKICGVARVINRVFPALEDKASIAAVRIFENARAPMTRGHVRDGKIVVAGGFPPVKFDDLGKSQIGDQVGNVSGNDNRRSNSARAQVVVHQGPQRRPMQVVEMRVRNQDKVNCRKIGDTQARTTQALQNEQPAREVGIDDDAFAANLDEETGMADECNAEFTVRCQSWLVSLAAAPGHGGVPHQPSKLRGALAKGRIAKRLFNHPAAKPSESLAEAELCGNAAMSLLILDETAESQAVFFRNSAVRQ